MNNYRQIKNVLYQLKRDFPSTLRLRNLVETSSNKKTGAILRSYSTLEIRKAILLPVSVVPSYIYDLSFIAANKNFTYGGLFGAQSRVAIVDGKDVPLTFLIKEGTQVLVDNIVYSVKKIDKLVLNLGYLLTIATLSNAPIGDYSSSKIEIGLSVEGENE